MLKRKSFIILLVLILVMGSLSVAMAAYSDIGGHWAEKDITWATEKGYLKGDGNGNFRPQDNVTKAEYVTGVNRLINSTEKAAITYKDVAGTAWYHDELAKGVHNGIIENSNDNFNPETAITRDEAAKIVAAAYKLNGFENGANNFKDFDFIVNKGDVGALVNKKVLSGWDDGNFHPKKNLTRAEYAKILRASVENMGLPGGKAPVAAVPDDIKITEKPEATLVSIGSSISLPPDNHCCKAELTNLLPTIQSGNEKVNTPASYTSFSLNGLKTALRSGETTYSRYVKNTCAGLCPDADMINAAINNINTAIGRLETVGGAPAPAPAPTPASTPAPTPVPRPTTPETVKRPEDPAPGESTGRPPVQRPTPTPADTGRPPVQRPEYPGTSAQPQPSPVEYAPSASGRPTPGRVEYAPSASGRPTPGRVEYAPSAAEAQQAAQSTNKPTTSGGYTITVTRAKIYVNNVLKKDAQVTANPGDSIRIVANDGFGTNIDFKRWEVDVDWLLPEGEYYKKSIIFTMPRENIFLRPVYGPR